VRRRELRRKMRSKRKRRSRRLDATCRRAAHRRGSVEQLRVTPIRPLASWPVPLIHHPRRSWSMRDLASPSALISARAVRRGSAYSVTQSVRPAPIDSTEPRDSAKSVKSAQSALGLLPRTGGMGRTRFAELTLAWPTTGPRWPPGGRERSSRAPRSSSAAPPRRRTSTDPSARRRTGACSAAP